MGRSRRIGLRPPGTPSHKPAAGTERPERVDCAWLTSSFLARGDGLRRAPNRVDCGGLARKAARWQLPSSECRTKEARGFKQTATEVCVVVSARHQTSPPLDLQPMLFIPNTRTRRERSVPYRVSVIVRTCPRRQGGRNGPDYHSRLQHHCFTIAYCTVSTSQREPLNGGRRLSPRSRFLRFLPCLRVHGFHHGKATAEEKSCDAPLRAC